MNFREFIKALNEADNLENYSVAQLNNLEIQFNWKEGDTRSILSLYVSGNTLHIDIGED